ncbi:MAG: hypothetical protein S4CHLAM81_07080 [Chlamydiales bacterium]|nr:hypothetical protein [Chlamydiales bacterium]MCH9635492.1 hypothetical protein [Chlamydiales bacterium]
MINAIQNFNGSHPAAMRSAMTTVTVVALAALALGVTRLVMGGGFPLAGFNFVPAVATAAASVVLILLATVCASRTLKKSNEEPAKSTFSIEDTQILKDGECVATFEAAQYERVDADTEENGLNENQFCRAGSVDFRTSEGEDPVTTGTVCYRAVVPYTSGQDNKSVSFMGSYNVEGVVREEQEDDAAFKERITAAFDEIDVAIISSEIRTEAMNKVLTKLQDGSSDE